MLPSQIQAEFERTADEVAELTSSLASESNRFRALLDELAAVREQVETPLPIIRAVVEKATIALDRGDALVRDVAKMLASGTQALSGFDNYVEQLKQTELRLRAQATAQASERH